MKNYILVIAIIFTSLAMLGCNRNASRNADSKSDNKASESAMNSASNPSDENTAFDNQNAPEFTLVDTKGKKISLADYQGKIVIIDFWATWCPPCRRGIPDLIEIQKEYKNKVAVIGISLDTDTKKDVVPFMKNMGINYPVVYANAQVVQDYGNIEAIPTSFVINKEGKIVNQHIGLTPKETYINEINKLLDKS
jgi:cytochrome c biogenesis protein CcmG/thiol:disulfide interchange protein DsbE